MFASMPSLHTTPSFPLLSRHHLCPFLIAQSHSQFQSIHHYHPCRTPITSLFPLTKLIQQQHIAASSPNPAILRLLLTKGASVHLRNKADRTPLFVAAQWGLQDNVTLLRESGAHLHPEEILTARMLVKGKGGSAEAEAWRLAGLE